MFCTSERLYIIDIKKILVLLEPSPAGKCLSAISPDSRSLVCRWKMKFYKVKVVLFKVGSNLVCFMLDFFKLALVLFSSFVCWFSSLSEPFLVEGWSPNQHMRMWKHYHVSPKQNVYSSVKQSALRYTEQFFSNTSLFPFHETFGNVLSELNAPQVLAALTVAGGTEEWGL